MFRGWIVIAGGDETNNPLKELHSGNTGASSEIPRAVIQRKWRYEAAARRRSRSPREAALPIRATCQQAFRIKVRNNSLAVFIAPAPLLFQQFVQSRERLWLQMFCFDQADHQAFG